VRDKTLEEGNYKLRGRIYIRELAGIVDRSVHTIRLWQVSQNGKPPILPLHLFPKRDSRNWRYWTPQQVDQIREWMDRELIVPGSAAGKYRPDPEQIREMLKKLREPRPSRRKPREENALSESRKDQKQRQRQERREERDAKKRSGTPPVEPSKPSAQPARRGKSRGK
jgi:hypothetical protein